MPRVLIIGTGIAGLFAALRLANAGQMVTVLTKQRPKDSSTNWAQDRLTLDDVVGSPAFKPVRSRQFKFKFKTQVELDTPVQTEVLFPLLEG